MQECIWTTPHVAHPSRLMCWLPITAQNAIRKKNEALNYLRLGSRLDAVVSRLDTQVHAQTGKAAQ